jgi:hypothetical protein
MGKAFLVMATVFGAAGVGCVNAGGWYIALDFVFVPAVILCVVLAFGVSFNASHSEMHKYNNEGLEWSARQTLIGDGAAKSGSQWNMHESNRLPSRETRYLDDGR